MSVYKFSNKKEQNNFNWAYGIAFLCLLILFNSKVDHIYAFLLFACSISIALFALIKKTRKSKITFQQIEIMNDSIKLKFFNLFKNPLTINNKELEIVATDDRIVFTQRDNGKLIGIAHKNTIENANEWTILLSEIQGSTNKS